MIVTQKFAESLAPLLAQAHNPILYQAVTMGSLKPPLKIFFSFQFFFFCKVFRTLKIAKHLKQTKNLKEAKQEKQTEVAKYERNV